MCVGSQPATTPSVFYFIAAQLPDCWKNLILKTVVLLKGVTVLVFCRCVVHLFPSDITYMLKGTCNGVSSSSTRYHVLFVVQ